jgi:hypothetical protein
LLREVLNINQPIGQPRRWFLDNFFDLMVWVGDDNRVSGFELGYDKQGNFRSITWRAGIGYHHHKVDLGESNPGKPKGTPILISSEGFNKEDVLGKFSESCHEIDVPISRFIRTKLESFPQDHEIDRPHVTIPPEQIIKTPMRRRNNLILISVSALLGGLFIVFLMYQPKTLIPVRSLQKSSPAFKSAAVAMERNGLPPNYLKMNKDNIYGSVYKKAAVCGTQLWLKDVNLYLFLIHIDQSGKTLDVAIWPQTAMSPCLVNAAKSTIFPPPDRDGWFELMLDMKSQN